MDLSINIGIRYDFCKHYYLKGKVTLSLLLSTNIVYFDTNYSITLYNIIFFCTLALNILIQKMVTSIIILDLGVNKYVVD